MAACTAFIWSGRAAYRLRAAGYEAILVPSLGANVISLKAADGAADILRTPPDDRALLSDPYVYGMPILFPANRVAGGCYSWDGVTYRFPCNFPNDVHIHGVLHNRALPVEDFGADEHRAWCRVALDTDTDESLRQSFPLPMRISLEISLSAEGLAHRFTVENRSDRGIPVGLAYHTAFNVGFCGDEGNISLHVPLAARCTDDPVNRLPNGDTQPLDEYESRIASPQGAHPLESVLDYLYTATPDSSDMRMRDSARGLEVVYRAGADDRYWILWNRTAAEGFICVEPQTWLSDAMHRPSPRDLGAIIVEPNQRWTNECQLFLRSVKD